MTSVGLVLLGERGAEDEKCESVRLAAQSSNVRSAAVSSCPSAPGTLNTLLKVMVNMIKDVPRNKACY